MLFSPCDCAEAAVCDRGNAARCGTCGGGLARLQTAKPSLRTRSSMGTTQWTGSARSWVAALCLCSHPAINSSAGCCRHLQLSSVKTSSSRAMWGSRHAGTTCSLSAMCCCIFILFFFLDSSSTQYVNAPVGFRILRSSPLQPEGCKSNLHVSLARKHHPRNARYSTLRKKRTFRIKPCITTPSRACAISKTCLIKSDSNVKGIVL